MIKGLGNHHPATIRGGREAGFFPEVIFEARPWFLRAWERAARNAGMMLLVEPVASGCESRLAGPRQGTTGDPGQPPHHCPGPPQMLRVLQGVQLLSGILLVPSAVGFSLYLGKGVWEASQGSGWVVMSGVCQQWEAKLPRQSSTTEGQRDGRAAWALLCPCQP